MAGALLEDIGPQRLFAQRIAADGGQQVEQVVRSLDGLGDEFRIERRHVGDGVVEACVVVAELAPGAEAQQAGVRDQLQDSLRSALGVTPEVRVEPFGTIERTTFKAKRLIDL